MRRSAPILVAFALLAATPAGAAGSERHCGTAGSAPSAAQDIRATDVSCAAARTLARAHARASGRNEQCDLAVASCLLRRYRCRRTFFGNSGTRVRCTRGTRIVRWFYGV